MRSKKAFYNTMSSLTLELVMVISGFIIPRLILSRFGSTYNGIISSITQFLSYINLFTAGVGGVTRASLYMPLEKKDFNKVSGILNATELFMRNIARIFALALVVFAALYPFLVKDEFDWLFTFSLVLILGIGTLAQYYFGVTYRMLLIADQKQYLTIIVQIISVVLNTLIAVILINVGASIHVVRLGTAFVYFLNPLAIYFYTKRKYQIDKNIKPDTTAINQRWDAFAHQVANFVHSNTDLVILSFFTSVKEISVYTVYYLVHEGVKKIITSITAGTEAAFGNMMAKNEHSLLKRNLSIFEFIIFYTSTVLFTSMGLLVTPFVSIYTKGITDVNYIRPSFGYLVSIAGFFFCIRIPYQAIARAAGHYKQTRNGAMVEAILNITLSLILVVPIGLVGVTIGTLAAMIFRSIQYSIYVSKKIIHRELGKVVKRFLLSLLAASLTVFIVQLLQLPAPDGYIEWIVVAFAVFSISFFINTILILSFYRQDLQNFLKILRNLKKQRAR